MRSAVRYLLQLKLDSIRHTTPVNMCNVIASCVAQPDALEMRKSKTIGGGVCLCSIGRKDIPRRYLLEGGRHCGTLQVRGSKTEPVTPRGLSPGYFHPF